MDGTERKATLIDHREVWRGRIFRVDADLVRLPGGYETRMEIVRHQGSVVLLPMPDPRHVVLVRQYRYAIDRWIWELPAGIVEPGESAEAAAERECEEEVRLVPKGIARLGTFFPTPGFCDESMTFFKLTDLVPAAPDSDARRDADEDLHVHTLRLDALRDMIRRGEVIDGKTVLGLALLD
jgi:8-oxo-dGTP pyrophosphatase MutT (NUDIX family)